MKTRTLLLLSLGCAVAILLAGAGMWWRVSRAEPETTVAVGTPATVGEMNVLVESAEVSDTGEGSVLTVAVRLSGTQDERPAGDFGLLVAGERRDVAADDCPAIDMAEVACTLDFDAEGIGDGTGFLVYRRGDRQAAWLVP